MSPKSDSGAVREIIRALKDKGAERVAFYDPDFGIWVSLTGKSETAIVKALMDYDAVQVRFSKGIRDTEGYDRVVLLLVFGNGDPMDLIADFSLFRTDPDSFSTTVEKLIDAWIA